MLNFTLKVGEIIQNAKKLVNIQGNLVRSAGAAPPQTLLVTSCHPHEGKTVGSITLACGLANEFGAKVVLIDGNLYRPKLHQIFDVVPDPGFSDFLISAVTPEAILRKSGYKNLSIIPHGRTAHLHMDYRSSAFGSKIGFLREGFQFVIVDGPDFHGVSDVSLIAKWFDGIVLIAKCEKTHVDTLNRTKDALQSAGGRVLGVVLNKRKDYIPNFLYSNFSDGGT